MSKFLVTFTDGDSDLYEASSENQLLWELRGSKEIYYIREVESDD